MKKLLARIKQWNKENAGLTLVEIIVTMLILVIIALPILGGFIVSARANAMAKDLAYARDAAENVVEVLDSGGVSEDMFSFLGWGYTPLTEDERKADSFTYTLTGISAGTGTYRAKVICNKTTYTDANNYVLPDMSLLDAEETVVLFPESNFYTFDDAGNLDASSDLHRFDTTAINDFYRDYRDNVIDIYNSIVYASYLDEVKRIEEVNKEIALQPSPSPTLTPPAVPEYPENIRGDKTEIDGLQPVKNYIHRTIDIKATYSTTADTEDADRVQGKVSTEYEYVMKDNLLGMGTLEAMINASFTQYRATEDADGDPATPETYVYGFINFTELDAAITDLVEKLKEPKEYAVAADSTVDTLESIYIVTYPFNASSSSIKDYNTLSLTAELESGVDFTYLQDKEVNVFLVIQEDGEYTPDSSDAFHVTAANSAAKELFSLYSQMDMQSSEFTFGADSNKLYKDRENSSGNALLDVTVKIYNQDDAGEVKELTQVKTTISSKK